MTACALPLTPSFWITFVIRSDCELLDFRLIKGKDHRIKKISPYYTQCNRKNCLRRLEK